MAGIGNQRSCCPDTCVIAVTVRVGAGCCRSGRLGGGHMWSEDGPCYIIAEAGSNHDGDWARAFDLTHVAAHAGADAVKFQCLAPFHSDWMAPLQKEATALGLDLLATPFDSVAVKIVADYCPAIKIASPEIVNLPLIRKAAETGLPLILSTGMAIMDEVKAALLAVGVDEAMGLGDEIEIILLQCTTRYPALADQANLRAMATMRDAFGVPVGLSDHTLGIAVPIAAAALGARIIEKHFTLDRTLEGPDHSYALEPDELKAMVKGIREVEQALGDGHKGPVEGELVEARGRQLTWT